jgi:uncharacterized protein YycO
MDIENYLKIRDSLKTGDCVQWKSKSMIGWLIRMFSGGDVNHTSLIVSIGGYDSLIDRKFLLEAQKNGIVLTSLSRRLGAHNGSAYVLPLKNDFDDKRVNIGNWAFLQVGIKYDYDSLFNQILGKVSADAEKYFCSEFVYLAYKNADIPMYNPDGMAPRPVDVDKLGIFKEPIIL